MQRKRSILSTKLLTAVVLYRLKMYKGTYILKSKASPLEVCKDLIDMTKQGPGQQGPYIVNLEEHRHKQIHSSAVKAHHC